MKAEVLQATLEEISAEIARLEEVKATLVRVFSLRAAADIAKRPQPIRSLDVPVPARRARSATASSKTSAAAKPRKKPAAKPEAAEAPEASDTGVRILKFLDKNGPTRIEGIAPGTKLKPNIVAIGLNKLVRDGLAQDNDGFYRCTDKGLDAALA
ncbi:MAG TPA: hypothetical protein VFY93_10375 [Planctomycetota bacterium]|nr:hypothetical protein [Planctomycetota bacterium]